MSQDKTQTDPQQVYELDDVVVEFNSYEEMTKSEKVELAAKQIDALDKLSRVMDRFGIDAQAAIDLVELDIEIDQSILSEFESRREALTNQLPNGVDNESGQDADGPPADDEQDEKPSFGQRARDFFKRD